MQKEADLRLRGHNVTLNGEKVTLRPMTESDWETLLRWNSDPEVLWFSEDDDVRSRSLEDVQGIYREVSQTGFCFIIEVDGRPIGECWLQQMNVDRILSRHPNRDCRRIDLTIGEKDQWGRGYGTDAIRTLTRFGFEEEGTDLIFGLAYDYNPRSRRAFEKAGYVENQRVEEPVGEKSRWSYDLLQRKQDYLRKNAPKKRIQRTRTSRAADA